MKLFQISIILSIVIFATGCPKYRPKVDFKNVNSFRGKLNAYLADEQKRYQCFRDGMNYSDGPPIACTGTVPDGPLRAQRIRDDLIANTLSFIDDAYGDFKDDLAAGRDRTNFVADLIELGTSAAVGITNGERPLQIMGIALTAFRGGRRSADVNFYKDQSTPILISKMNGNRAGVRAVILDNQKKAIDVYPIGFAISDIVEYYNAGTLVEAFTKLSEDTAVQTKKAEDDLKALKKSFGVLLAPTADQIRVSRDNANAIEALTDAYDQADIVVSDLESKIAEAQEKIAAANQRITDENAQQNPSQDVLNEATADRTRAEADKVKFETEKSTATTDRVKALDDLKATYEAIEGDPALSPLLDKIPELPGYSSTQKSRFESSLQRLRNRTGEVDDYARILGVFGKIVRLNLAKDPTLNERLQTILKVTQE